MFLEEMLKFDIAVCCGVFKLLNRLAESKFGFWSANCTGDQVRCTFKIKMIDLEIG